MSRGFLLVAAADLRSAARAALRHPGRLAAAMILLPLVGGPTTLAALTAGALLEMFGRNLAESSFVAAFTASGLFVLLFGTPAAISTFFTDRRLLLLAASPVRPGSVYAARLLTGLGAYLLVAWPLLMLISGYGLAAHAGAPYLAAAALVVVAWLLGLVGVQVAALSALLRLIPARLVRDAIVAGTALVAAGLAAVQLSVASGAGPASGGRFALAGLRPANLPATGAVLAWLPSAWPARALVHLGDLDYRGGLSWLALVVGAAVAGILVGGLAYGRALVSGAAVFGEGGAQSGRRARPSRVASAGQAAAAAPLRAMLAKDWLGLRRDVRRLSGVVPGLIFGVGYPLLLSPGGSGGDYAFGIRLFAVSTFPLMLASTLGVAAIAGEGRAFHLLTLAPRRPGWVLGAKLAFAAPPVILGGAAVSALVLAAHGTGLSLSLGAALFVAWLGAGFVVVAVAGGAIWSTFQDGPAAGRMSLFGVSMVLLGSFAQAGFSAAALVLLLIATRSEGPSALAAGAGALIGFLLAGLVCLAYALGAVRRLGRLEPGH